MSRRATRLAILKVAILVLIAGVGVYCRFHPSMLWHRAQALFLAFAAAAYFVWVLRGRWRDTSIILGSFLFAFAILEVYVVATSLPATIDVTTSQTVPRPILGWGPAKPGVYHHIKKEIATGRVVFDTEYTIDADLHRRVISAPDGPVIAFVGGSDTYGLGLPDADTLPQQFADAVGRRLRVINFAYPGYGPQQFLRAVEAGLFDQTRPKLFAMQVTPWLVERTSCISSEMARGPRYELIDGQLVFRGICGDGESLLARAFSEISSIYVAYVIPALQGATPAKIDLLVAILARGAELAREKYGAETVVIYEPDEAYLRPAGYTDTQLMQRLRDSGLLVVDGELKASEYPGQDLAIPGEGHPTVVANRAWAALMLRQVEGTLPRP